MIRGKSILVLEDEPFLLNEIVAYLESCDAEVTTAKTLEEARQLASSLELDLALLDIHLPDGRSLDLIKAGIFRETTAIVVMTSEGGVDLAVEAMRLGAGDYLSKPFDPEELPIVFGRLLRQRTSERVQEQKETHSEQAFELFQGERLTRLRGQLDRILDADVRLKTQLPPILIEGETGTGKSTLARWLHRQGPRSSQSLIEVNCSTLPDTLAESELFGHEKGAFTDAHKSRIGLFEAASDGTLFLDEIASLSPAIQTKVLTAIEDRQIRRVGGTRMIQVDVRLIAASLVPLEELVAKGEFREDLFHRLKLLQIRVPALREFPQDIPPLAHFLWEQLIKRHRLKVNLSDEILAQLTKAPWPGNVRELAHELERGLIFHPDGNLDLSHLNTGKGKVQGENQAESTQILNPNWTIPDDQNFSLEDEMETLTREIIMRALEASKNNVSAAARSLGVPRDFIRYRLQK